MLNIKLNPFLSSTLNNLFFAGKYVYVWYVEKLCQLWIFVAKLKRPSSIFGNITTEMKALLLSSSLSLPLCLPPMCSTVAHSLRPVVTTRNNIIDSNWWNKWTNGAPQEEQTSRSAAAAAEAKAAAEEEEEGERQIFYGPRKCFWLSPQLNGLLCIYGKLIFKMIIIIVLLSMALLAATHLVPIYCGAHLLPCQELDKQWTKKRSTHRACPDNPFCLLCL